MSTAKIKAVLAVIIVLLAVAVVCSWVVSKEAAQAPVEETPVPSSAELTPEPTPSPTAVLITPKPTPVPTPKPTPVPTPEPTPVQYFTPSPTPAYVGDLGLTVANGTFSSQSGVGLELVAGYTVTAINAEEVSVTLNVGVSSYALYIGDSPNSLLIQVGGQYITMSSPAVSYDGPALATHTFGSQTVTVRAPAGSTTNISVDVNWQFNGTYSGQAIPSLECGGTITVSR